MNDSQLQILIEAQNRASATLEQVRADVQKMSKSIASDMSNASAASKTSIASMAKNVSDEFNGVADRIAGVAKAATALFIGGALGVGVFINAASGLQSLRASFESLTGSIDSTNEVMGTLYDFGLKTSFTNQQIQTTAKSFLAMGVSVSDLPGLMQDLGDIAGATGSDLGAMSLQISQAFGKGKLELSDWKILSTYIGGLRPTLEAVVKQRTGISNLSEAFEQGAVSADILREALDKANDKGNFAFEGAIKQANTFNGRLSNLWEGLNNVMLGVLGVNAKTGEVDPNGKFAEMSNAVKDATDWLDKNKKAIGDVAKVILDNAVPAIAAMASAWAAMKIVSFAAGIVSVVAQVTKLVSLLRIGTPVAAAFSAAISANPIGLIAIAIAAVVAGLVFLQVKFGIFTQAWNAFTQAIQPVVQMFQTYVLPVLQQVGAFVAGVFMDAWRQLQNAWQQLMIALQPVMPVLQQLGQVLLPILGAALLIPLVPIALLVAAVIGIATAVAWVIARIAEFRAWIIGAWNSISGSVTGIVAGMINRVLGFFNGLWNAANTVASVIGSVVSWFAGLPGRIIGGLGDMGNLLVQAGLDMINGLVNGLNSAKDAVVNKIKDIAQGAVNTFKSWLGIKSPSRVFMQMGDYIGQGLVQGLDGAQSAVANATQALSDTVLSGFNASPTITPTVGSLSGAAAQYGASMGSYATTNNNSTTTNQFMGTINLNTAEAANAFLDRMGRDQELAELGVAI